jgi:hypothetical protein
MPTRTGKSDPLFYCTVVQINAAPVFAVSPRAFRALRG